MQLILSQSFNNLFEMSSSSSVRIKSPLSSYFIVTNVPPV